MAKKRGRGAGGPNRSKFIRDMLDANRSVSWAEVKAAWDAAGHTEKLNPTLYYHACKKLGISRGGKRGRKPGRKPMAAAAVATPHAATGSSDLKRIESRIDDLIREVSAYSDVAAKLADARRVVSYRIVKSGG